MDEPKEIEVPDDIKNKCKDFCIRSGNKDLCLENLMKQSNKMIWSCCLEPWERGFLLDTKIIAREKEGKPSLDLQRPRKVIKA